jgi:hypothetical protein
MLYIGILWTIFTQDEAYAFKDSGSDGNDDKDEEGEGKAHYQFLPLTILWNYLKLFSDIASYLFA